MPLAELIGLLIIGAFAGVMSGMFGIGGGAIIVPALVIFMGFTQVEANGTSLVALLLPVAIFAAVSYYRAGKLNVRVALALAAGIAMGSWFGANIALGLQPDLLEVLYGLFLWYMAWRNIAPRQWWLDYRGIKPQVVLEETVVADRSPRLLALCVGFGILAGVLSGMFGIGGGVIIVTILTGLLSFDQKLANGTSLGALLLPTGLPGVIRYYEAGQLDILAAVPLALMLVIGSIFGARAALGLPAGTVRRLYGFFLFFIGIRFLFL
ncbi:MAG: sulfite exporter TauE/SafE family protein [Anaerolineae bacterium]|jgi:hypothetical protein|nr:sulfite exporter TauE/SafE family protein [Anaerolineae bacterium]